MLSVLLELMTPSAIIRHEGQIYNVSKLAALSDYGFSFEGRQSGTPPQWSAQLSNYPRWCESPRGLMARCLSLTEPNRSLALPPDWQRLVLKVGLRPGGQGALRLLSMVTVAPHDELGLAVGWEDQGTPCGFVSGVPPREQYLDVWSLAEHALRVSAFAADVLAPAKPLEVPVRQSDNGLAFVCTSDVPEPARTVFEKRMAHATRPLIAEHRDAVYAWDWTDFLNGQR